MSAQPSTEESESVIGRIEVVGVGEIGDNENLEENGGDRENQEEKENGRDGDDHNENDIDDGNDFNLEEQEIVDEQVVDLIENENENEIPEAEAAFIENFSPASKLPTDSEEQIRQSVAKFVPPKGYEKLPLAKKDRSVIHHQKNSGPLFLIFLSGSHEAKISQVKLIFLMIRK